MRSRRRGRILHFASLFSAGSPNLLLRDGRTFRKSAAQVENVEEQVSGYYSGPTDVSGTS
jgi:hypothetical protein